MLQESFGAPHLHSVPCHLLPNLIEKKTLSVVPGIEVKGSGGNQIFRKPED